MVSDACLVVSAVKLTDIVSASSKFKSKRCSSVYHAMKTALAALVDLVSRSEESSQDRAGGPVLAIAYRSRIPQALMKSHTQ